jgi:hypothetical protein
LRPFYVTFSKLVDETQMSKPQNFRRLFKQILASIFLSVRVNSKNMRYPVRHQARFYDYSLHARFLVHPQLLMAKGFLHVLMIKE